jgi:hypothetical protein
MEKGGWEKEKGLCFFVLSASVVVRISSIQNQTSNIEHRTSNISNQEKKQGQEPTTAAAPDPNTPLSGPVSEVGCNQPEPVAP